MTDKAWSDVDQYYGDLFAVSDPIMAQVLSASDAGGLPHIQISPLQGRMLMLLAQAMGARRILEIGSLGGYSTIWLARALPADGKLVTLEFATHHAEVARTNIAMAGFAERVDVRQGAAADTLAEMIAAGTEPFDLIFIDADKNNYDVYLEQSLKLVRPGSLIIADNMVRRGAVVDGASTDANVQGTRRFNELLARQPHIVATAIQTVGDKGYDGFVLARVTS